MGNGLRRLRGALGMGFIWAVAWGAFGFVPRWVFGINGDLPFGYLFGGLGFLAGIIFSALLVLTARRRRFEEMSLRRFAVSGALAGLVIGALFVRGTSLGWREMLAIPVSLAAACAVCASVSLAMARRASMRVV